MSGRPDPREGVRPAELPFEGAPPEVVASMKGIPPTVQQWEAISHPLSPCAVIAGAGSGKTAVMAARVVYLALARLGRVEAGHAGALPSEVLCLTFTNKAAEELFRRVRDATAGLGLPEGEEAAVLTYHAFAARLLHDYGLHLGLGPEQRLLSEAQRWQLCTTLLDDMDFEHVEVRSDYVVGLALQMADQCSNHLVEPNEVIVHDEALLAERATPAKRDRDEEKLISTAQQRIEICRLAQAYQDRKREIGAMDYGDQIFQACRLVERHPEVGAEFRARYAVLLLDEYQDTNVAQARLLQGLVGRGYPVFAVGDPDQNIYAWRGASLTNLLSFLRDFGDAGADPRPRPLYVNFRSGSRILDVANTVIAPVPPERRAAEKELRPHPSRGEGRVAVFIAEDAYAEARRLASIVREEAERRGTAAAPGWSACAILCRKSRLFPPIAEVFREEGIPLEVVDLGGLLKMPEVVEVVAWLRLLDDPGNNVALARILQGARWRIGFRDLASLARWSAARTRSLRHQLPGDDDMPGDVVFALAESLDHLDGQEIPGLSREARERLVEFRGLLREVRSAASGTLEDLVSAILERSGLLAELEASANPAAPGARRNLLNFVHHVSQFSPAEGEASLSTLVTYLRAAEEREDDLERAQPSEDNTVKALTIHKAKGLEWPVVFVPGLTKHRGYASSIFPDVSRQANPITQKQTMPFELRGDRDLLPPYQGDLAAYRQELEARGLEEERRLCYVAFTRAQELLVGSAAHWYEGQAEPHEPGMFYREAAGHEATEVLDEAGCPEESPLLERRRRRAGVWPAAPRAHNADVLFPEGWHAAAVAASGDAGWSEARAGQVLDASARGAFERRVEEHRERAALIRERTAASSAPEAPGAVSVTSVETYLRCPRQFYWSVVRPLPRRPNEAARVGSEIHRWIELQGRGQATLDLDDLPDLSWGEVARGEPGDADRLRQAFKDSRFAGTVPLFTERPFILWIDGVTVRGRIDAIFGEPDGKWEIVDYKTGRVPKDDPLTGLQLDIYALACVEVFRKRPEDLTLTYFYLGSGEEITRPAGDPDQTRKRIARVLSEAASGRFDATPGEYCNWCDFQAFCKPGQRYLATQAAPVAPSN